jgi:predicted transposase/invertase (TIGR01784 family)
MPTFLSPQNDAVFKLLFGKSENSELLIDFLTAVLAPPVPIDSVTIQNPEIPKHAAADKTIVLDVVAKLSNGQFIDIEMQVAQRAGFRSRVLFYLCRMHQNQMDVADEYLKIKPSVSIAILGYKETDEEKFHSVFELQERDSHKLFSQDLSIHLIELPKLKKFLDNNPNDKGNLLALWSRFFMAKSKPEIKELAMQNPIFQKAEAALDIIIGDPEAQELARLRDKGRMMYQYDLAEKLQEGERKGRQEGKQEGRQEGEMAERKKTILNLHSFGISPEKISEMLKIDLTIVLDAIANQTTAD